MKFDVVYDVPIWAALYIMYGEDENLSVEEKEQCDAFLIALKGNGVIYLIEPADCSEQVFNKYPAFGKPCSTQDWIAATEED